MPDLENREPLKRESFQFKEDRSKRSRWEWLALAIVAIGLIAMGALTFHPWLTLQNSDGATFYILAAALKQGLGYKLISLPYPEQVFNFTPLWPLVLSGLMIVMNTMNPLVIVPAAKWLLLGIFMLTLALFNHALRVPLGRSMALVLTLLLAVSGTVHQYLGDLLSDLPYLLFSLVSVGFFIKRDHVEEGKKKGYWIAALTFLAMSILARPIGLALGIAVIGVELLRKQWKPALAVLLTCGIVFGSWSLMEHQYRSTQVVGDAALQEFIKDAPVKLAFVKYFAVAKPSDEERDVQSQTLGDVLSEAIHRVEQYGMMMAKTFWPITLMKEVMTEDTLGAKQWEKIPGISKWLFFALTLGFLALGWRAVDERYRLVAFYPVVYMGILLVYPYVSGRYLLPILPFLVVLFFVGLEWMLARLQFLATKAPALTLRRRAAAITAVVALLSLVVQLQSASVWWARNAHMAVSVQGPQTSVSYTALYQTLVFLHALREEQEQKGEPAFVLISRKPELAYYYSGVKSLRYPFYSDEKRLFDWLKEQKTKYKKDFPGGLYILEDQAFKESHQCLSPVFLQYQEQFERVYQDPDLDLQATSATRVWRMK